MDPTLPPYDLRGIESATVLMPCESLEPTLSFFVRSLGFRVDAIFPAESPRTALIGGHGLRLRLAVGVPGPMPSLTLLCADPAAVAGGARQIEAPNGAVIRLAESDPAMRMPATVARFAVTHADDRATWTHGRAGLRYRDLLPERHGGAFVASHIRILEGGPVPDYVHFHKVRFQMIYCRKGWVRVVYQGQGEPFVLEEGDCVLQPPKIRHRVLESSAGAEVVEIGSPAEHITMADHAMTLPNERLPADHDFDGQRFVRHVARGARWSPWRLDGFEFRDTGIGAATDGLAGVRVVRRHAGPVAPQAQAHDTEFTFYFVLSGKGTFELDEGRHVLARDGSITLPGRAKYTLHSVSDDFELLEVTLPAVVDLIDC